MKNAYKFKNVGLELNLFVIFLMKIHKLSLDGEEIQVNQTNELKLRQPRFNPIYFPSLQGLCNNSIIREKITRCA